MFSLLNEVVAYVNRNNSVRAAKNSAMSDHDLHNDNIRRIIDYFLQYGTDPILLNDVGHFPILDWTYPRF